MKQNVEKKTSLSSVVINQRQLTARKHSCCSEILVINYIKIKMYNTTIVKNMGKETVIWKE
jgi:hypothetical protein